MTSKRTDLTRRGLLKGMGGLGMAAALAACGTGPRSSNTRSANGPFTWWDHNLNLQAAQKRNFGLFEKETGVKVEYTNYPPPKLGPALQLAKQSNQLPDVHSLAGLKLPPSALIKDGWFRPLGLSGEMLGRLPKGALVDGVHVFDGKVYTVPIFSSRQYWGCTWFNKDMLAAADTEPPGTYDDFRAAAGAIRKSAGDDTYGVILALSQTDRMAEIIHSLAQPAGFEGFNGTLFESGEVMYHHDAYLTVIEFLLSLQKDGLVHPSAQTLIDKDARVKWAAGAAGFFLDGPWNPGSVKVDAPTFLDKVDVAPMLVPDSTTKRVAYRTVQGGVFWLSKQSAHADKAPKLLQHLTDEQYYVDIASALAQPPLDLSVIDKADVIEPWARLVKWYGEQVYLAPNPIVQNPQIDKVNSEAKPVEPDFGQIVAGAFSGDVPDVKKALTELSSKSMAARDQSISKAKQKGAEVDAGDFAFPNWQPGKDFTTDMYGGTR
jgi:multiple sugar transport system substrate-binding protein